MNDLGPIYGALAELEGKSGDLANALRWNELALRCVYQAGKPEGSRGVHNNLANYCERHGQRPSIVLAHRLAAASLRLQTQSGLILDSMHSLASSDVPLFPPSFSDVARQVEAVEGVGFQALFERYARSVRWR